MMSQAHAQKELLNVLGERIRERRKALGFTQEQLAELAGMSVNFLARMEMAGRTPSFDTLIRLADALKVEVSDLLHKGSETEWLDQAHDIAYSLGSLSAEHADFVIAQMRSTIDHLKRTCAEQPDDPQVKQKT